MLGVIVHINGKTIGECEIVNTGKHSGGACPNVPLPAEDHPCRYKAHEYTVLYREKRPAPGVKRARLFNAKITHVREDGAIVLARKALLAIGRDTDA